MNPDLVDKPYTTQLLSSHTTIRSIKRRPRKQHQHLSHSIDYSDIACPFYAGTPLVSSVPTLEGLHRFIVSLLAEIFEVEMVVGSVGRLRQAISDAVAMPVAEVHEYVQQQAQVSIDETSFQQGNADGQNPTGTFMLVMGCGDSLVRRK